LRTSLLLALAPAAAAQVAPAAVRTVPSPGFQLPTFGGSLSYALSASQSVSTGFYNQGGAAVSTNVSGDLAYLSSSVNHPFSAIYSGAVLAGDANQQTEVVQNLALSQVFNTRFWGFTFTDAVSYLPLSPSTGLAGIPGLGDLGVPPVVTGPVTGQGALTGYAPRVSNSSTVSVSRRISGKTSLEGTGSFVLQRFTDDQPGLIDSNQAAGSLGINHVLGARSSVSANYTMSKITYNPDLFDSAFNLQSVSFGYTRQFSRSFSLNAQLGPQWIKTSAGGSPHTTLDLATDTILEYRNRQTTATLGYVRGANSGFGVIPGGFSDSVNGSARRTFFRIWNIAATVNYTRTSDPAALELPHFSVGTLVAGVQGSRALTRTMSAYASYNAQHQSTSGAADTSGAFRGLYQVVSFGVTYSPRTISFRPQ
jgi:hypothetical protein